MKPEINLKSPEALTVLHYYELFIEKALTVSQNIEKAVIPLYGIPARRAHQNPKAKPIQFGTGVIVNINGRYFIFSAKHVISSYGTHTIMTGGGNNTPIESLLGEAIDAGESEIGGPACDASVFCIHSDLSDSLKNRAISLDDMDLNDSHENKSIYMISGFRSKKSNTQGSSIYSKQEVFPTMEYGNEDYKIRNIDIKTYIALVYEDQTLIHGIWSKSPEPKGMSGGAIIRIDNLNLNNLFSLQYPHKQLLSAITIEHHKKVRQNEGMVLGIRISIFLDIISNYIPDFLRN